MSFASPWISDDRVENIITAGAYHAVALDLGRISQDQAQSLKEKLESTKAKLEAQNFTGLTKDELVGELLYTTALMYHAEYGMMKQIAARAAKVASVTWPSETIFKTDLTVDSIFGLPRSVGAGGLAMDADKLASVTMPLDGDQQKKIGYLLQAGMASSALEHSVPEQLFSTPENPAEGISAVKALQIANEQDIPIYTVTQANLTTVLPQLQVDIQVKADIQNAVSAGKTVTVSKADINFTGWVGCGYIIVDPQTGAGSYMIGGGLSGAVIASASFGSMTEYLLQLKDYGNYDYRLKLKGYGKAFGVLNKVALFASIIDTMLDEKLTNYQKVGNIVLNVVSSLAAEKGISMLAKTILPTGLFGAGVALGVIFSISIAVSLIFIVHEIQIAMELGD